MLAAYVIFLSFKYNAAKFTVPSFCDLHLVGKRDMPKCSYSIPLRGFSSLPSHTQKDVTSNTSLPLGRLWVLGKVRSGSFKEKRALPNPAPSLLPLHRARCNVTLSQTRMSTGLNFSKEGEPYSVHSPYRSPRGLWPRQGSQENEDAISIFSVLGSRE